MLPATQLLQQLATVTELSATFIWFLPRVGSGKVCCSAAKLDYCIAKNVYNIVYLNTNISTNICCFS